MAYTATCSDRGAMHRTNQDALCVQVADTRLGEVAMIVVCDGVGGLAEGELASATVVNRFVQWFQHELPAKVSYAAMEDDPDLAVVEGDWRVLLARLNAELFAYGEERAHMLGTTISALLAMRRRFLAMHVGDGRILKLRRGLVEQVSEDQTLLALKLRNGELLRAEDALPGDANTILQAVGTQERLDPLFYRGDLCADELMIACTDGAWRKATNEGICQIFRSLDFTDEAELERGCRELVGRDIELGETDNITVACLCGAMRGPDGGELR